MITGTEQAFAGPSETGYQPGMDIRTWLTGQAISGIMGIDSGIAHNPDSVAEWAISIADATIKQLNKPPAP